MTSTSFNRRRNAPLRELPGVALFSKGEPDQDVENFIVRLKARPQVLQPITDAAEALEVNHGRRRLPGSWPLLLMVMLYTKQTDFAALRRSTVISTFRLMGFAKKPSATTIHDRLTELTAIESVFQDAIATLVGLVAEREPDFCRGVAADGTASASPFHFDHCCAQFGNTKCKHVQLDVASPQEVKEAKQRQDAGEELDVELDGELKVPVSPAAQRRMGQSQKNIDRYAVYKHGGCYFRCLDKEAGLRSYGKSRYWFGYYHLSAVDVLTGIRVAVHCQSANVQEMKGFPDLLAKLHRARGLYPHIIAADRGFSYPSIMGMIVQLKIGYAIPYRRFGKEAGIESLVSDAVDRMSVPRCEGCGAQSTHEGQGCGVHSSGDRVYIAVKCTMPDPEIEACHKVQLHDPKDNPRLYNLYDKRDTVWAQASCARNVAENANKTALQRYMIGGTDWWNRLKVRGVGFQGLTLALAAFLDLFRMADMNGWFDNEPSAYRKSLKYADASVGGYLERAAEECREHNLRLPQGAQAVASGRRPPPS